MDDEKAKFQMSALKLLYELELLHEPQLINNLKLNLISVSRSVRDVEFVASYSHRSLLIYLDLTWFGKKFRKQKIISAAEELVTQLLPRFKIRVIADRDIFDLSLDYVKKAIGEGGLYASSTNDSASS